MKYIPAEKLIAEIERRQEQLRMCCGDSVFSGKEKRDMIVAYEELDRLRYIITSLKEEQPEVDLEKEMKKSEQGWYNEAAEFWYKHCELNKTKDQRILILDAPTFTELVHDFYELGKNTKRNGV